MNSESTRYLGLLERRLNLLESLTKTLSESRRDFISRDLGLIENRIAEQEQFCAQIRSLDVQITNAQIRCGELTGKPACTDAIAWPISEDSNSSTDQRIRDTMARVAASQMELKRLNNIHQAMLRRSRHSVRVLMNLFKSYAPTYGQAAMPANGMYEERV